MPGVFALHPPAAQYRDCPYSSPGKCGGQTFPLGTDEFGRDVYSRICHGLSVSLLLAPAAVALSLALALVLGLAAGYSAGWLDTVITRAGEVFLALPSFYFVVAMSRAPALHLNPRTDAVPPLWLL